MWPLPLDVGPAGGWVFKEHGGVNGVKVGVLPENALLGTHSLHLLVRLSVLVPRWAALPVGQRSTSGKHLQRILRTEEICSIL